MTRRYKAAFLVPIGANRTLGEYGWEFESAERLSEHVGNYLVETLGLEFVEEYSGIKRYSGQDMNMSVFLDKAQEVESIYFQLSSEALTPLSKICRSVDISSEAEFFVP